jgi:hypothetical protein
VIDFGVGQIAAQRAVDGSIDLSGELATLARGRRAEEDPRFAIAPAQN